MPENDRRPLPPYVPYKTFGSFLDHLRAIGVPSHIDKSVMTHLSGGMQSWLKAALRYLALINADDTPTPTLEKLAVAQDEERKKLLRDLFTRGYAFLNGKLDLKNTTPFKLRSAVADLGAQGETVEKIIAFMIAMAKDANITVSPLLLKRASPTRRAKPKQVIRYGPLPPELEEPEPEGTTTIGSVHLPKSGGSLTLRGDINLYDLVGDERELVFALIDTMRRFDESRGGDE
jgi:hypothetical protein